MINDYLLRKRIGRANVHCIMTPFCKILATSVNCDSVTRYLTCKSLCALHSACRGTEEVTTAALIQQLGC